MDSLVVRFARRLLPLLLIGAMARSAPAGEPIALHPDHPHYFLFRGKPTVLITSGEHYGAVLNGGFDYIPYLDELHSRGFNLTRTFSGTYREQPSSFNIEDNPLSPSSENFVCPFAISDTPGAAAGGAKFDLTRWNDAYFARLKDFVAQAGKRGIVVELSLFCAMYDDGLWKLSPLNPANIINPVEAVSRQDVYTTRHPKHLALQEALVRKIVGELKDADNVYFEICNEPYFGFVSSEWNDRIAGVIAGAEKDRPHRHLISQNIANGSQVVKAPNPNVSILNFHYAKPPNSVAENFGLRRAIADDETGFSGTGEAAYRVEAWDFVISGGAVFDNLDYSFTPKHPDGTFQHTRSPGGGGPAFRRQLQTLKQFVESFDFVKMSPDDGVIRGGTPDKATARALVQRGAQYAIYIRGGTKADLRVELPSGNYEATWLHPSSGETSPVERFAHSGGVRTFASPNYADDIALAIRRR
ncbi:MAG TPA: putative collagen-binding domain-containing protein [Pirellulales bacterium]|nr:putative collagen-binding domain-containing protein [Pirellulales bacterium]